MTEAEIRQCYEALPAIPDPPRERSWCQRLATFAAFMANGPVQADYFRMMVREFGADAIEHFRRECPPLYDLLLASFPDPDAPPSER